MFVNLSDTIERIKFDFHEDNQNDFLLLFKQNENVILKSKWILLKLKHVTRNFDKNHRVYVNL